MFKENDTPIYALIDWSSAKKWSSLSLDWETVGGVPGVDLVKKYANKNYGVIVEHLEFKDGVKFFVAENNIGIGIDTDVLLAIEKSGMVQVSLKWLIENCNFSYPKISKQIRHYVSAGRIIEIEKKINGKGRPRKYYEIVNNATKLQN